MSKVSLEFVSFLIVLLVIAAAFDLWLLRTWNRSRRLQKRKTLEKDFTPASLKPGSTDKGLVQPAVQGVRSKPGAASPASAGRKSSRGSQSFPPVIEIGAAEPTAARSKRAGKTVSQKASLSVQGSSGRTAHVDISMELPEGESIRLTLESISPGTAFPAAGKASAENSRIQTMNAGVATAAGAEHPRLERGQPFLSSFFHNIQTSGRSIFSSFFSDAQTAGRSLFFLALAIYLLTRLIGLAQWPIYFFTDEAVQTNFAAGLVKGHFVWENEFLPTFFNNAGQFEMNVSVYVQVIPYLIFGKSVFVTRAISVLITLLGAAAIGWILRRIFRLPLWWSGVLLFSIIPVWFLHSRTAFEPAESITFYLAFLYFYMRYRNDKPWMLLPALFFGALSAYTYSPAQVVMAVTGGLLFLSDLPYHGRHKWIALTGFGLLILLALPYLRFLILHPEANRDQLAIVGSYWVNDTPLIEKLKLLFIEYLKGFDPRYWYLPYPPEGVYQTIIRHLMKGYGHLALWSLPFTLVGLLLCLWNIRLSKFRTVLITLLAAPLGGAIAQITITRVLFMVVPSALLTALGVSWVLGLFERYDGPELPDFLAVWRERAAGLVTALPALRETAAEQINDLGIREFFRRWKDRTAQAATTSLGLARVPYLTLALGLFLLLGSVNGYMLWDSLVNGPTWYHDYSLYGMQYGGEQLSSALMKYKQDHPDANLIVTTSWANGTDEIFSFFLPDGVISSTDTIRSYIQNYIPINAQDVIVMTADEYQTAQSSGRFTAIPVLQTLPYPDGRPGFYFTHPVYIDNIQDVIAAEKAELAKPVEEDINLSGEMIHVVHSRFDMGSLADGFDGDPYSVIRTLQDNPMFLDLYFPASHQFTVFHVRVGGAPTKLTVKIYPSNGGDPIVYTTEVPRASDYRDLEITLSTPIDSNHIRLEIETVGESPPTHVHVYEIQMEGVGWKSGIATHSP
ncbi:MAG: hypothetical protein ABSC61_02330 [Anaerolineales bacterium]